MSITGAQRVGMIAQDQQKMHKDWERLVSDFERQVELVKQFGPWKNDNFLENKGEITQEDMDVLHTQFLALYARLQAGMDLLMEIGAIPNADLTTFRANNNAFISKHGVDILNFDLRYKV